MGARNFYAGLFLTLVATTALASSASASPSVILNGNFEQNYAVEGYPVDWQDEPGLSYSIYVQHGSDFSYVTGSTAALANHFAFFGYPEDQAMYQNFPTVIGQEYVVSFDFGVIGTGSEGLATTVTKTGDGNELGDLLVTADADNDLDTTFANYSYDFTATGTESALFFIAVGQVPNVNAILDNVSVVPVPEPDTWGLVVIGIGLMGFRLRRRAVALAR